MNNIALTEQDVFKAADDIFQQTGKAPTGRDLLARLKRGSMSTINPHLQSWLGINLPYVQLAKQSSDLAKLTHSIFSNLRVNAESSAQVKIDATQKELDASKADLRTQVSETTTAKKKCTELSEQIATLTDSLTAASETISDLRAEVAKEKSNTETARAIANERHGANTELKHEIMSLKEIKLQADAKHESDSLRLQTDYAGQIKKLQNSEDDLKAKNLKLQNENQNLNMALSENKFTILRLKEMLKKAEQEQSRSEKQCLSLQRNLDNSKTLKAKIEQDAMLKISEKDAEIALLDNTLASANQRLIELQNDKDTLSKLLNKHTATKSTKKVK